MPGTRDVVPVLVVLATALAPPVRAADLSLQLQPGYSASTLTTKSETGEEHRIENNSWLQRYRLTLEMPLYPQVVFSGGGLLDWNKGTGKLDGVESFNDSKRWIGFGHLRIGSPLLFGGLDYDRRDETGESSVGGARTHAPRLVSDSYGASLGWHPPDLPSVDLQLHRLDSYDWTRERVDRTTENALLATRYKPVDPVDLGLAVRGEQSEDHITQVRTRSVTESVIATYSDSYLGGRAAAYASYSGSARVQTVTLGGGAGTVPTLQLPAAGLSIVEVFPAIATQVTLNPNAALIDGNTSASAGLNLGFSASTSAGGQRQYRDIGAQFANVITPVNMVYVWVDRQVPADVAATFTWEAYRSDDNVTWTRVDTGPVQFGLVDNRFEIPIQRTEARYLKVVTRPMAATLTSDPQLSEIFVTEAQFLQLVAAAEARGRTSAVSGSVNSSGRLVLLPSIGLTYDVSSVLTHSDSARVTWAINNGLSASKSLTHDVRVSGRVDRSDLDSGRGHEASNRWAGSLIAQPLPTVSGSATYSGQYSQNVSGNALVNNLALTGQADLYEGIAVSAGGSAGVGYNETGQTVRSTAGTASLSLIPNRNMSVSGGASYVASTQTGGGLPEVSDRRAALDVGATVRPFPALALTGGASRFFARNVPPQTLWNFGATFSPLPGGALSLRYTYQESYDSSVETRSRLHGPALRWNIRPGWFFDSSYSFQDTHSLVEETSGRSFNANLIVTLR